MDFGYIIQNIKEFYGEQEAVGLISLNLNSQGHNTRNDTPKNQFHGRQHYDS